MWQSEREKETHREKPRKDSDAVDGDYSAWQRSPVLKSAISSDQMSERPTSPETEIVRLQIKVRHFIFKSQICRSEAEDAAAVPKDAKQVGWIMKRRCSKRQLRSTWSVSSDLDLILVDLGAIGTIRQQSEESVALARQRLEETRLQTAEDLSKLEEEYLQMEKKVNDKTNECEVLIKFKGTDKEYHMRVARLNELKVELENLVSEQKTERSELAALVSKHHSNLNLNITERCREIQATLTAEAVQNIPQSLKGLAHQNRVMKREIELHRDNIAETEREVALLQSRISDLQQKKCTVRQARRGTPKFISTMYKNGVHSGIFGKWFC
eukprot:sb/3466732/